MEQINKNPFLLFNEWYQQARSVEKNCNAMFLATCNTYPSVRTVLLKQHDTRGFVFYTNLNSNKAQDLIVNPYAELLFFWRDRQIRIKGQVTQVSTQEADEYFSSRNRSSQIGAWASNQSQIMSSGDALEKRYTMYQKQFSNVQNIPRPEFWSGFRVSPDRFEFWQEQEHRLHVRHQYQLENNAWILTRLYP